MHDVGGELGSLSSTCLGICKETRVATVASLYAHRDTPNTHLSA